MIHDMKNLLKDAYRHLTPTDRHLCYDPGKAHALIQADIAMIRAAEPGNIECELEQLETLLSGTLSPLRLVPYVSLAMQYKCMLLLLKYRGKITSINVPTDKIMPLMEKARPLCNRLSGEDPFPEVFGQKETEVQTCGF